MSPNRNSVTDSESDLIRGLYPKLRRFAAVVAPVDMEPDDRLQEALVKTLRNRRLDSLEYPAAYLWKAMSSLAMDGRRSSKRRGKALARLGRPEPYIETYPSDLAVLETLSPKSRAVLYLHDVEGLPFQDIAVALGGKASSLRRTATRARRTLLRALSEEELDATA